MVPWGVLEMYQDTLCWRRHEQHGISAVIQEKSDPAISFGDREMTLQHRGQEMEDQSGSCWSLDELDRKEVMEALLG